MSGDSQFSDIGSEKHQARQVVLTIKADVCRNGGNSTILTRNFLYAKHMML